MSGSAVSGLSCHTVLYLTNLVLVLRLPQVPPPQQRQYATGQGGAIPASIPGPRIQGHLLSHPLVCVFRLPYLWMVSLIWVKQGTHSGFPTTGLPPPQQSQHSTGRDHMMSQCPPLGQPAISQ
jgi:hypothetical protein